MEMQAVELAESHKSVNFSVCYLFCSLTSQQERKILICAVEAIHFTANDEHSVISLCHITG